MSTAGEVRRRLRRARSAHRETSLGAVLTDVYMVALLVAVYGAFAVTAIRRHLRLPAAGSPAESGVRAWLLIAVVLVLGGLAWAAVRDLGPLYVTGAARYWAAGAPVDRAGWLRPALGWVAFVGAACGALFGVGVMLIGDTGWGLGLAATFAGAALPAAAVVAQAATATGAARPTTTTGDRGTDTGTGRRASGAPGRGTAIALAGSGTTIAIGVVVLDGLGVSVSAPAVPLSLLTVVAGLVAVGTGVAALRRLGRLDAAALSGGAQLADAATVSLVLLQPAMFSDIVEVRRWRRVGSVHSGPLGPPPSIVAGRDRLRRLWTLVRADLRRQVRRPGGVLAWAGLGVVPYAMTLVAPGGAAPARVVAGYLATERLCAGLRTICRSAALRRLLGGSDLLLRLSHLPVPAVALALWWPATLPASPINPAWAEPLLAVGVLAAAYRAAGRRPTRYDGAAVDTPFGIVQPDLVTQIVRGPDLVAALALAAFTLR
ncbi:DUF6297 family protein [Virgisporangium aurantiacum]|uniref:Uncharacterized protein n=1 Tax=Virgisporangium aurantiacum TaxID=175570 RepID=A0A8J3Z9S4_9ACTN|nr:DUF6297 family protein [Virgisporangium aurantiacum]GIJ60199.1 hypothetical protein Vau01_077150 [Virgisporangium aurantiacum]